MDYHPRVFTDWIMQVIKVRRGILPEEIIASLKSGIAASLRSGTTSAGDIVTSPEHLAAFAETSINGRLYLELIGQDEALFGYRLANALEACSSITGSCHAGLSPHSPYTLNRNILPSIASAASGKSLPLSLHLAESEAESDFLFDSSGPIAEQLYPFVGWQGFLPHPSRTTPVRYFDEAGLLGPRTLAVHCVHVTPADALILKERGVTVCLCPRSNERLDVGTAPVHLFKKLDIPLSMGTDSLASNDSLSIWDEIRFALDKYKGLLDPEDLLRIATNGGARGIGLQGITGSFEPGKQADFQVVEMRGDFTAENLMGHGHPLEVAVAGFSC